MYKLYYWNDEDNFGDALNINIFEKLLNQPANNHSAKKCNIIMIGSILDHFLTKSRLKMCFFRWLPEVKVFGSGIIKNNNKKYFFRRMKIFGVRGYKTLELVKSCKNITFNDNIYIGDLALITPILFDINTDKKYDLGIIPHFQDKGSPLLSNIKVKNSIIIDVQDEPLYVVNEIAKCRHIISSSLHGLIIADTLNIPNIRMNLNDSGGGNFKFDDYYTAFDIYEHTVINLKEQEFTDENVSFINENYKIKPEQVIKIRNDLMDMISLIKE